MSTLTESQPLSATSAAAPKRKKAPLIFASLVVLFSVLGLSYYLVTKGIESTDDAQVEGRIVNVSARVPGQVAKVNVSDNQAVQAGDVLVVLDDVEYQARLAAARADFAAAQASLESAKANLGLTEKNSTANLTQARGSLKQAGSSLDSSKASLEQARADVVAAESRFKLAKLDFDRSQKLVTDGVISQSEFESKTAAIDQARASLEAARAKLTSSRSSIDSSAGGIEAAKGRMQAAEAAPRQVDAARAAVALAEAKAQQSEAALHSAELNLQFTQIKAPSAGIVSKRNVELGNNVGPERALLAIVPTDDVWIVANFKEDQMAEMIPGRPATIVVDTYKGTKLKGHVESTSAATGARFSLLPPDNASGNFVKVVQRVPVLIRLDEKPKNIQLRAGMSATVKVNVDAPSQVGAEAASH